MTLLFSNLNRKPKKNSTKNKNRISYPFFTQPKINFSPFSISPTIQSFPLFTKLGRGYREKVALPTNINNNIHRNKKN